MLKSRRHYDADKGINNNLAYQIHQINNKIDSLLQSHKYMIDIVLKVLKSKDIQTKPHGIDYQVSKVFDINRDGSLLDSHISQPFHEQQLPNNNHTPQDEYITLLFKNEDNEQKDMDEFNQRMQQWQYEEQSAIQAPSFQKSTVINIVNNQHYFIVEEQNNGKIKLTNSYKILDQLQTQFMTMNLKFKSCQCLYHYPQMTNEPFYQKITDKNNILFLALLQNQQIIGAFTEIGFSSKTNLIPKDNPKCCLLNLSRRQFLYAHRTNKTHSCDKSYILFGNWQYKIKMGQNIMHSDLGTRGDCFKKQRFGVNQNQVNGTRQWIFGNLSYQQNYKVLKYMICTFK